MRLMMKFDEHILEMHVVIYSVQKLLSYLILKALKDQDTLNKKYGTWGLWQNNVSQEMRLENIQTAKGWSKWPI